MNIIIPLFGFIVLVGIIYFIVIAFRKKPLVELPKEKKSTTRIMIETSTWIASAVISLLYVYSLSHSSILFYSVIIFWMTMIGFYTYDDSCKRYLKTSWNIGWAIAIGIFPPLFIIYYFIRPPANLKATGTSFKKKLKLFLIVTVAFISLVIWLDSSLKSKENKTVINQLNKAKSKIDNLSQDEKNRFYELSTKVEEIILSHLDEQDKAVYIKFKEEVKLEPSELTLNTMRDLLQKANQKLTPEERQVIIEFQKLRVKLTASGSH